MEWLITSTKVRFRTAQNGSSAPPSEGNVTQFGVDAWLESCAIISTSGIEPTHDAKAADEARRDHSRRFERRPRGSIVVHLMRRLSNNDGSGDRVALQPRQS